MLSVVAFLVTPGPWTGEPATTSSRLLASAIHPHFDSDGDLLPDGLEWVLLLDPHRVDTDGDGVDDFLHAVQNRLSTAANELHPMDHEVRVVVSGMESITSGPEVWVNMLFRFVGRDTRDLTSFVPYIDSWGIRLPLANVLGYGSTNLAILQHPHEGLYVLFSVRLTSEESLRPLLPCTIGATATLGGRTVSTGSYLQSIDGATTTLVPVSREGGVLQTIRSCSGDDPFWTAGRVCLLRLCVVAVSPGGALCEVTDADCVYDGRLACPPTCRSANGNLMFFPDGMGTVTGGG